MSFTNIRFDLSQIFHESRGFFFYQKAIEGNKISQKAIKFLRAKGTRLNIASMQNFPAVT